MCVCVYITTVTLYLIQVLLFTASYYRQLSADIRIKNSFMGPDGPKARANKTLWY